MGKSYATVTEAVHASAHNALHSLLLGTIDSSISGVSLMAAASTDSSQSLKAQHVVKAQSMNVVAQGSANTSNGQEKGTTKVRGITSLSLMLSPVHILTLPSLQPPMPQWQRRQAGPSYLL